MQMGFDDLDDDRATNVILLTDAVANVGVVEPKKFQELLARYDVRVFGFLLGNNANWPLMRTITQATGGFSAGDLERRRSTRPGPPGEEQDRARGACTTSSWRWTVYARST